MLPGVELTVIVGVQKKRQAAQSVVARLLYPITVDVVELLTRNTADQTVSDRDHVVIEGHGAVPRKDAPINRGASLYGNTRQRKQVTFKGSPGSDCCRTPNLPVNVAGSAAIDHHDAGITGGSECCADQKIEFRIGVALGVQRQSPGQLGG